MNWYSHQQKLIDENPAKKLVAFGCGAGKTRTILQLCKNQGGSVLVVAPKTQIEDQTWEREMQNTGIIVPLTTISKEKFKKGAPKADILVLDEAHVFLGVTASTKQKARIQYPKTSQIFDSIMQYIETNKPRAVYLASATPIPQPMALFAIAHMLGQRWDYFKFRETFYTLVPHIGRGVWIPKKDEVSKVRLGLAAKKLGVFGRLQDFMDVPPQTHKTITVGLSPAQNKALREVKLLYPDAIVQVGKRHQIEQGIFEGELLEEWKTDEIIELSKEFDKMLVFVRYTAQIRRLESELKKKTKHTVLTLTGETKDRRFLLEQAEKPSKTIVIAQSQISAGYELPSFRCTVFASMSYAFVDFEQALGRTLRANNLQKNLYVYLIAGPVDKGVLECVQGKKDFNELLFTE